MNSLVAKIFVFITEMLSAGIIGLVLLYGMYAIFTGSLIFGASVAIFGTVAVSFLFGFAAIMIEIHKNLVAMRAMAERRAGN